MPAQYLVRTQGSTLRVCNRISSPSNANTNAMPLCVGTALKNGVSTVPKPPKLLRLGNISEWTSAGSSTLLIYLDWNDTTTPKQSPLESMKTERSSPTPVEPMRCVRKKAQKEWQETTGTLSVLKRIDNGWIEECTSSSINQLGHTTIWSIESWVSLSVFM